MPKRSNIPETVGPDVLAVHLGVTPRRVSELARRGGIPRADRGEYPFREAVHAFAAYQIAEVRRRAGSTSADALREQRTEEIGRRMRKEEKNLVMLDEALEVFDELTVAFVDTFDQLEKHLPEAPNEIADEKARFQVSAARIRRKLVTGNDDAVETGQAESDTFDDGEKDR